MANYKNIVPILLAVEGGLSKSVDDMACKFPLPDGSGYHTNKGVTWKTFQELAAQCGFVASVELFYAMPDYVWAPIFKIGYWDKVGGDKIQSQAIADTLVDWAYLSGPHTAVRKIQEFLKTIDDGAMGPNTLNAINHAYDFGIASITEKQFNENFTSYKLAWLLSLPGQEANYEGWKIRVAKILAFTNSEILNPNV